MRIKQFLFVFFLTLPYFFLFCEGIFNPKDDETFITKIGVEGIAKKYLPEFEFIRKRAQWNRGREFVYQKSDNQVSVFLTVGIYQSHEDAVKTALAYLKSISGIMQEGPIQGVSIGDELWWSSPNPDSTNVADILFIRRNALFRINSRSYGKVIDLAKAIDADILEEESYISIENSITLPKINSITLSKNSLKEGESIKITVNAIDPRNESLEYQYLFGLFNVESDPENVFTFIASRNYVPEPFLGVHTIEFVVINSRNVVSRISEIAVNIIP
ncbi:MAG: hypothetical protein ACOY90_13280 [Candidatus Zhuqueibacterota bacterium]